MTDKSN